MKHAANCLAAWLLVLLLCGAPAALAQDETTPATPTLEAAAETETEAEAEPESESDSASEDSASEDSASEETEPAAGAQPNLEDNQCVLCHGTEELWDEKTKHLFVRAEDLAHDVHWKKGIYCQDCHGGNAETTDLRTAHAVEDGFRKIGKRADEVAFCGHCHANAAYLQSVNSDSPVTVVDDFLASIHGQNLLQVGDEKSATCTSCHTRHAMRGKDDPASSIHPGVLLNTCGHCHDEARQLLLASDHKTPAGQKNADGVAGARGCRACHTEDPHQMRAVRDAQSPVFVQNQVETCGYCHEQAWQEYRTSVHGEGLEKAGLLSTAICASCHGTHGVLRAENAQSRLHHARVADTCGTCHRFIADRLRQSVHGLGDGPGQASERSAPGGTIRRTPSCTDCHMGHDLPDPRSAVFRNLEPDRCGNCHADLYARYGMSMHGALTNLGYTEGAKCSDCHGAHDILPLSDPRSLMAPENRLATCSRCHQNMPANLARFDPHADHHDAARSPVVFWAYRGVLTFIIVVFGFFGLHALCWFVRGLFDVRKHGRPRQLAPHESGYLRFRPFHRVAHTVMVVSFLGLALTGLPLKFSDYVWAKWLAALLGGFASTGIWHRVFSLTMFGCFLAYVLLLTRDYFVRRRQGRARREVLFGPDSPLPNMRDATDLGAMVRWFVGRGPRPTFERWAYWEKFDFFGATSDTILIGLTGLVLWFPNWFCLFLPGEAVNVAKVVHSTLALLATGFVFAIHFFGTHFRPDKFPMDVSILTGIVSEEEMRHERPEMLERLQAEGRLEELRVAAPSRAKLCGVRTGGVIALLLGLASLAGIVWSLLR